MGDHAKKKKKKPHWIYPGDMCWLTKEVKAYPATGSWDHTKNILRILYTDEPVRYVRRTREGRGGPWVHHIECVGMKYVYHGSIHDFTKRFPE